MAARSCSLSNGVAYSAYLYCTS